MVFLFEEIAVEAAMIIATLVATACLLVVLAGLRAATSRPAQRRARRRPRSPTVRLVADRWRTSTVDVHALSQLTSPTSRHPMGDIAYIVLVLIGFIAVYSYARFATRL